MERICVSSWVTPQMVRTLFSEINTIYVNEQQPPFTKHEYHMLYEEKPMHYTNQAMFHIQLIYVFL